MKTVFSKEDTKYEARTKEDVEELAKMFEGSGVVLMKDDMLRTLERGGYVTIRYYSLRDRFVETRWYGDGKLAFDSYPKDHHSDDEYSEFIPHDVYREID